ncbi:hypothetical protein [Bradyrhizobium sp. SYSU BS000235]|uniref:hypothetical protein n=1 Tax=Bradyrhizobium sp. SYSU BS000235 TaxID=3411332 RepID=UPI003C78F282
MKRFLMMSAVLLSTLASASADQMHFYWRDAIRPHGHKRSNAVFNANVSACNGRAGVQSDSVSLAYKECMHSFGYRFRYARILEPDELGQGIAGPGQTLSTR